MDTSTTQSPDSLGSPSGSPSSDTPETDDFILHSIRTSWCWREYARNLERERNNAYARIRDCVSRMEECADGYEDTRKAIADLSEILPENNK